MSKVKRGKCWWLFPVVKRKRSQGKEVFIRCRKLQRKE